jgi:hypothetical protein
VIVDVHLQLGKIMSIALREFDVNIKKIRNKKTMSVIDDMLNSGLTLFRFVKFIMQSYTGSFNKSKNSIDLASI